MSWWIWEKAAVVKDELIPSFLNDRRIFFYLYLFFFCTFFLCTGFFIGCGIKGPPVPPDSSEKVVAVENMKSSINDGMLILTWPLPTGLKNERPEVFIVYRSKQKMHHDICEKCPQMFKKVASIRINNTDQMKKGYIYKEALDKDYKYAYLVSGLSGKGAVVCKSKYQEFSY